MHIKVRNDKKCNKMQRKISFEKIPMFVFEKISYSYFGAIDFYTLEMYWYHIGFKSNINVLKCGF